MALTDEDKQWIAEQLERVETSLLTEFHKWASPVEMRVRSHSAALRALDLEQEALADRLNETRRPVIRRTAVSFARVRPKRPPSLAKAKKKGAGKAK